MLDTMEPFQLSVFNKLNGALNYNSTNVPVSDELKRLAVSADLFVILSTQQESDSVETSDTFITTSSIDIEVWMKTEYSTSKRPVHDVSNQILQLLIPAPYGQNGLGVQDHFQFQNVRRTRALTRTVALSDTQTITGKIITISADIVQQSP